MTQDNGGLDLSVFADLGVKLGSLTGSMDKLAGKMDADASRKARLNQNIIPLKVEMVPVTVSATADYPNILGPREGWYWDIHTIIGQAITGSTAAVAGYLNSSAGVQVFNITTNGQLNFGKLQCYLSPGERLVYVGNASLTSTAIISVRGVQIAAPWFGDYVL